MISIVLIEPENPGNIGAIARIMANFSFNDLIIINPKCDHLCSEAIARSKHALPVLENAKVCTWEYLKNFDAIVGTTAKLGTDYNIPRSPLSPKNLPILPEKTALLFGRESSGLTNDEINICDFIVTIPSKSKYPVLNLSHAVAILLYELADKPDLEEKYIPASAVEKKQILKMIDEVLDKYPFDKKESQQIVWKRLLGKSSLTKREAYVLMGFFQKL